MNIKKTVNKEIIRDLIVLLVLAIILFSFKMPVLDSPYIDDEAFWYVPKSLLIEEQNFNPIFRAKGIPSELEVDKLGARKHPWLTNYISDFSHPPMFYEIMGFSYWLFGYGQRVSHIIILLFALMTIFLTYKIGNEFMGFTKGVLAALMLFFTPVFFGQSARIYPEIPIAAMTLLSLYFYIKNNKTGFLLSASILVLLKEQAVLFVLALIIYDYYKTRKFELNYFIPILVLIFWYLFHYQATGLFMYYANYTSGTGFGVFLSNFLSYTKFLLLDQFRFVLIIPALYFMFNKNYTDDNSKQTNKKIDEKANKKANKELEREKNQKIDKEIARKKNINKTIQIISGLTILFYLILFSWKDLSFMRHIIPLFPLIFLVFVKQIPKKILYFVAIILIVASFTQYNSETKINYEENMRYSSVIKTHQLAINYIQENYLDRTIWVDGYSYLDYTYPYVGYVDKPVKVNIIPTNYIRFKDQYYPEKFKDNFKSGDIIIEDSLFVNEIRQDYKEIFNLNLENKKEFIVNNDYTKIYEVK